MAQLQEQFNSFQFIVYSLESPMTNETQRTVRSVHIQPPLSRDPHIGTGKSPTKNNSIMGFENTCDPNTERGGANMKEL